MAVLNLNRSAVLFNNIKRQLDVKKGNKQPVRAPVRKCYLTFTRYYGKQTTKTQALMTKKNNAKEPVHIRMKQLAGGGRSIYLDIYQNGHRRYEFLKLYLLPGNDCITRQQNRATMEAARTIKARRTIEIANEAAGIKKERSNITLHAWMLHYRDAQLRRGRHSAALLARTIATLAEYAGQAIALRDVDREFGAGFIRYLTTCYTTARNTPITAMTALNYYRGLCSALNAAVREGIIPDNPMDRLDANDRIKVPESRREYLTIDEVKRLIDTPCKKECVKQAYLFSCFCGLRISDIEALQWGNIVEDGGQRRISIIMRKTRTPLYLPLSVQAQRWMPQQGGAGAEEKVFTLPSRTYGNNVLRQWARTAGIHKHVTYHTARHTFATMMLTLGADLYTTSKLLGHSEVRTTQIYAKIINKKKDDAVNLVNSVFV